MIKPDDDLRKDSRMMETAGLLNRLFAREPVSRRRNLYLRRYAASCILGPRKSRLGITTGLGVKDFQAGPSLGTPGFRAAESRP